MKMSRALAAAGVALGMIAGTTTASDIPTMTMTEVYQASDTIVHGRVTAQQSRWENTGGARIIFTYSTVEVYASLKGKAKRTMTVRTVGGSVGDYNQALIGEAAIGLGEEVVLFLERVEGWKQPAVVGFYQGKYTVDSHPAVGVQLLRDGGQESGGTAGLNRVEPMDEFLSQLNAATTDVDEDGFAQLIPMTGPDMFEMDLAIMSRTIQRGTYTGDLDRDGRVDGNDVEPFIGHYLAGDLESDLNNDGIVDYGDLTVFTSEMNR